VYVYVLLCVLNKDQSRRIKKYGCENAMLLTAV